MLLWILGVIAYSAFWYWMGRLEATKNEQIARLDRIIAKLKAKPATYAEDIYED